MCLPPMIDQLQIAVGARGIFLEFWEKSLYMFIAKTRQTIIKSTGVAMRTQIFNGLIKFFEATRYWLLLLNCNYCFIELFNRSFNIICRKGWLFWNTNKLRKSNFKKPEKIYQTFEPFNNQFFRSTSGIAFRCLQSNWSLVYTILRRCKH